MSVGDFLHALQKIMGPGDEVKLQVSGPRVISECRRLLACVAKDRGALGQGYPKAPRVQICNRVASVDASNCPPQIFV